MGPRGPRASPTSDQRRSNNPRLFCRFQNVVRLVSVCRPTRARREPYDPDRVALFTRLARTRLATETFAPLPERPTAERRLHAFWEAYFSNYIEGTVFTVQEAREIVFDHKMPAARPKDAHDILSTFHLATDGHNRREIPRDAVDFLRLLEIRHARLMHDRLDIGPVVSKKRRIVSGPVNS
jgi:hypothetical protein